jgi:AraC-like DNA-binding protein
MKTRVVKDRVSRPFSPEISVRLRPAFEDFHVLRMHGDYEYPRHQHTNYEVILVERGPYCCELNGVELKLSRGEVLFIKPDDWHQDHLCDGQKHYVIHFHFAAVGSSPRPPPLFSPDLRPPMQVIRGNHLANATLVRELRREAQVRGAHGGAIQDCLLEAFFWRLMRAFEPVALSAEFRRLPRVEELREELLRQVEQLSDRPVPMSEFARKMRMSVRRLHSLCQSCLGQSAARLLLEARIRRAEDLIRFSGLSSKEVSDRLGFANPFHFSRAFRRVRGVPPSSLSGRKAGQVAP